MLARVAGDAPPGAPVCIVVNDRRDLYPEILERAGLRLDERLERHVNRRTGRRAGEYFESILIVAEFVSSRTLASTRRRSVGSVLARSVTHALVGLEPRRVEVEAHIDGGLPASRSSGSPTAPARRRSSASAAGSARRSSSGR